MSSIHWLVVGIIVFVIWATLSKRSSPRIDESAPSLRTTGRYFREVVGESNYQAALKAKTGGKATGDAGVECTAVLIPENGNRYDKNAVMVAIDGETVGYLPRDEARLYRGRLKRAGLPLASYSCPAKIVGGGRKSYGVWLDLPDRLA